jgi:site-specific DNA-methyltransferase (adenine-specific)
MKNQEQKKDFINKVYNMDCLIGIKSIIPDNTIDLIITDPPFGIDFRTHRSNYHRTQSSVIEGYNEIKKEDYYDFTYKWMKEAYRVLKETGSMYVFSGWNNLKDILNALDNIGFITINHIIWKYQFGVVTKNKFVTSHYHCLYVCKNPKKRVFYPYSRYSKGKLRYHDIEDVWEIKREYWHGIKKTPTKLPSELIKKILQYSSKENDIILDPFLGSGQVAVVSKLLNRKFVGFEISKEYYNFIQERFKNIDITNQHSLKQE